MTTAAVQTIWADLLASTLADAGVRLVVISPGSRSTPLVAALASTRLELVTIIDERAAAFYALGAARATDVPVALVCTSGTAAAHYLPALVEASLSCIPLVAITADRPPELQACGASQTIDQRDLYGRFVRASFDLGAPHASEAALRSVRRTVVHAVTLACGGHRGPVHVNAPFRKPLEPAAPSTQLEHDLARLASELRATPIAAPPRLVADAGTIDEIARVIAREPDGVIVAGALPVAFANAREDVFALAVRAGYPVITEAGSQLRLCAREPAVVCVDHFDLVPVDELPVPRLLVQLGAEPVAASWPAWLARARGAERIVLAGHAWHDPEGTARVVLGDVGEVLARIVDALEHVPPDVPRESARDARQTNERAPANPRYPHAWAALEDRAARATATAIDAHARSETAVVRAAIAAMPDGAIVQVGNSLPIRVIDHAGGEAAVPPIRVVDHGGSAAAAIAAQPDNRALIRVDHAGGASEAIAAMPDGAIAQVGNSLPIRVVDHAGGEAAGRGARSKQHAVITQRGAAGIDGLIASAAGATRAGKPVLLVLGDVSFAHDLGGLLVARAAAAPLAIVVVDNRGGQIFSGLPIARAEIGGAFAEHWLTAPGVDPAAVATALGIRAVTASSATAVASAVAANDGVTVIHAPVSMSGAHDVRRAAIELFRAGEQGAREMKSS